MHDLCISLSFMRTSWIEVDLLKIFHCLAPQFLESGGQTACQFVITNQQRREAAFGYEGMIEGQYNDILIDDVKRVAEFARVAYASEVTNFSSMFSQEFDQPRRGLIGEAEHRLVADLPPK